MARMRASSTMSRRSGTAEFWEYLKPAGGGKVPGKVEKALVEAFGSVEKAMDDLAQAGVTQFGSGWAWLEVKNGKVAVSKTPNAENPLIYGATPILTVDVWERPAYYMTTATAAPISSRRCSAISGTGNTSKPSTKRRWAEFRRHGPPQGAAPDASVPNDFPATAPS